MNAIWKYPLNIADVQIVEMPLNAEILCVQMQGTSPCLWALVNPEDELAFRKIEIFGTGHSMLEANRKYIGTVQSHSGALVWHVFERV